MIYYQVSEKLCMQVSLTVVVDRTFALGGVDLRACFFIDHCCVNFTFTCFFFSRLKSQPRNVLTAKFSQCTYMVYLYCIAGNFHENTSILEIFAVFIFTNTPLPDDGHAP